MVNKELDGHELVEKLKTLVSRRRLRAPVQILRKELKSDLFDDSSQIRFVASQGKVYVLIPLNLGTKFLGNTTGVAISSTMSGMRYGSRFMFEVLDRGFVDVVQLEAWKEPVAYVVSAEFLLRKTGILK